MQNGRSPTHLRLPGAANCNNVLGHLDIQFLGIGGDEHIGFNEPADAFCGPVTPQVPASILQFHPNVVVIDEARDI